MTSTPHWKWFIEYTAPSQAHMHGINKYIYCSETPFQKVEIVDTPFWGRCLILDGKIQSAEYDEFIYHESLIQPAMVLHPSPRKVLILGGGEGAVLREVLRHEDVETVLLIDIDSQVVELCKTYLSSWNAGTFDDPRVEVLHTDARKFIEERKELFDIIIGDLTEPVEEGPSYLLYTKEFFALVAARLAPGGVFALQAGSYNPRLIDVHSCLYNTLQLTFAHVRSYHAFIPSFDTEWGFLFASHTLDPLATHPGKIDQTIKRKLLTELAFYDEETHRGMFAVPKNIRQILAREKRIISDDSPLFTF